MSSVFMWHTLILLLRCNDSEPSAHGVGLLTLCCIISFIIDKKQHSFIFSKSVEECATSLSMKEHLTKRRNQAPSTPSSFAWRSRRCTILLKSLSTSGTFEFLRFGTSFHILTYFILLCPTEIQRNANLFRTNQPITLLFSWRWPDHERKSQTRNESCLTDDRSIHAQRMHHWDASCVTLIQNQINKHCPKK